MSVVTAYATPEEPAHREAAPVIAFDTGGALTVNELEAELAQLPVTSALAVIILPSVVKKETLQAPLPFAVVLALNPPFSNTLIIALASDVPFKVTDPAHNLLVVITGLAVTSVTVISAIPDNSAEQPVAVMVASTLNTELVVNVPVGR